MGEQNTTMKAVYYDDFGGVEQVKLGRLPIPHPGPNEVQIKVQYSAVNPVDWKIRSGLLKNHIQHEFPLIPGWDVSGTISDVGKNVTSFKRADKVFAYCRKPTVKWGTYAEYVCFEAENVALMPTNLSFAQASAFPLAGLTAWQAIFDKAQLKKAETILIHAGAGGVGSLGIQFAKQAGAKVITTASESNRDYLLRLGADAVIDYRNHHFQDEVKKIAPEGVDVAFDTLGGQALIDTYPLLKKGGRIVSLIEEPDSKKTAQYEIKGFYLFVMPNGKELLQIAKLIEEGKVLPIPVDEMPLDKAGEAQEINRQGHVRGKIVLKVP